MKQILLFPVCIKKADKRVKLYIPDLDAEFRAADIYDGLRKGREYLLAKYKLGLFSFDNIPEDPCSQERVRQLLQQNSMEEYLDAQIIYIELDKKSAESSKEGNLVLNVPYPLLEALNKEKIDYKSACIRYLYEVNRRQKLFTIAKELCGHTVEISTEKDEYYYGEIKKVSSDEGEPWDFTVVLRTSIFQTKRLEVSEIEDITEIPVTINELGTFHLVDHMGLFSLAGSLYWHQGYIDVYLEFDPYVPMEEQRTFAYLSEFNEMKYSLDREVKMDIAIHFAKTEVIRRLFPEIAEMEDKEQTKYIIEHLPERLELWFINISANQDLYMDYNYSNRIGNFSVGVSTNLLEGKFSYKLNKVSFADEE